IAAKQQGAVEVDGIQTEWAGKGAEVGSAVVADVQIAAVDADRTGKHHVGAADHRGAAVDGVAAGDCGRGPVESNRAGTADAGSAREGLRATQNQRTARVY